MVLCVRKWVKALLSGQYNHSVDAKGRVIMPSRFREELGETFWVTKGYDHCLVVYSETEWKIFAEKLLSIPSYNAAGRKLVRMFSSGAVNCEVDKQGRILLPAHLREHAGIQKEVVITGTLSSVEIWDAEKWEEYNGSDMTMEDAAEELVRLTGGI